MNRADLIKYTKFLNETFLTYKLNPDIAVNTFLAINGSESVCACEASTAMSTTVTPALETGKLYVIGCGSEADRVAEVICANHEGAILVCSADDLPAEAREMQTQLPRIVSLPKDHTIELIPKSIEFERIEKPKHKGHERPYKFHR